MKQETLDDPVALALYMEYLTVEKDRKERLVERDVAKRRLDELEKECKVLTEKRQSYAMAFRHYTGRSIFMETCRVKEKER